MLLFAATKSVFKLVKVSVVEIAKRMNLFDRPGFRYRSAGDKSVGCLEQANRCLTSCGGLHSMYICSLVRLTAYACSHAIDGSVLTVVVRECIVVFG